MLTFKFREFGVLLVQFCLCFGKLLAQEAGGSRSLLFGLTRILR